MMGTRAGDVDPGLFTFVARELGLDAVAVERELNRAGGLVALAGTADMRAIERRAGSGDTDAQLALHAYAYRVRKYVGAYYAALGELHAVVLTGGVGQHAPGLRAAALGGLERLGIVLDAARNNATYQEARTVSADGSEVAVLVVPTDEEWEIARQALEVVRGAS